MLHEHAKIVDALGGPKVIAVLIEEETGKRLTPQAVSQWKLDGIAWKRRALIKKIARAKGQADVIPPDFLDDTAEQP